LKNKTISIGLVLYILLLGIVPGCTAATPVHQPTPTPATPTQSPAPVGTPALPGNPPANRAPVIENHSLVNGSILTIGSDPKNKSVMRIQIHVTASNPAQGSVSFTDDKVGNDIEILVKPVLAAGIKIGDTVQVQVTYRGDEFGGNFYGSDLSIMK